MKSLKEAAEALRMSKNGLKKKLDKMYPEGVRTDAAGRVFVSEDVLSILLDQAKEPRTGSHEPNGKKLSVTEEKLALTENELSVTKEELAITKEELSTTEEKLVVTGKELAVTKDELAKIKEQLAVTEKAVEDSKQAFVKQSDELSAVKEELANEQKKTAEIAEKQAEIERLELKLKHLQERFDDLQKHYDEKVREVEDLKADYRKRLDEQTELARNAQNLQLANMLQHKSLGERLKALLPWGKERDQRAGTIVVDSDQEEETRYENDYDQN